MEIIKDVEENKRVRLDLLTRAENDQYLQQLILKKCANGIDGALFFMNMFLWLYEPRNPSWKTIPFVTWDFQDDAIKSVLNHMENGSDLFIDKSRDMGVSWLVLACGVWGFRFMDWSGLVGSRKQDEVDKLGDLDTLMPKLRFMWYKLPEWMRFEVQDSFMNFVGPSGQSLVGESTNEFFGTGGRRKWALLDEFSKWEQTAWPAWTSLADTTPCRIVVSTPYGSGTKQAELRETNIDQLHLHWTKHPQKSEGLYTISDDEKKQRGLKGALTRSPWYDREAQRRTEDEIAQELDINYEKSAAGRVYGPEWDELVAGGRLKRLDYDPGLATFSWWDFGMGDLTAVGIAQVSPLGETVHVIDYYENNNQKIEHYHQWLMDHKYRFDGHYGDIAGDQRNMTGRSVFEWLNDHDVQIQARHTTELSEKHAVQLVLPKTYVDQRLTRFIKVMNNFRYEWDDKKGEYKEKPHHDRFSHGAKAFAYFAVNHFEPEEREDDKESRIRRLLEQQQQQQSLSDEYKAQ